MADTYPHWLFDTSPIPDPLGRGARAVEFCRRLRHPKSTASGRLLQLAPWQERVIRAIYGPVDEDGDRLVREVFLMLPRGSRKTSLCAALGLLHLVGPERVDSGQIMVGAVDREQAGICFREARDMIAMDKRLERVTRTYDAFNSAKQIVGTRDGSTLRAVSSDGRAQHGTTPTLVILDELHAWRSTGVELHQALMSGLTKRPGGLVLTATTAGRGREGLAAEKHLYAVKVARGEIRNPAFLPVIFETPEDADWTDEAVWDRYNPGLRSGFIDRKKMRADVAEAKDNPAKMYELRQLQLNTWFGQSMRPLFDFARWDARTFDDPEEELEGLPAYVGVDYALSGDLCAIVTAWKLDDGQIAVKPRILLPAEGLEERERLEGAPYRAWTEAGHVEPILGPIVPQQAAQDVVREIAARHDLRQIGYDPWRFRVAATELAEEGLPVVEMRQGAATMGPATADLQRAVTGGTIRHDGHPVLRAHLAAVSAVTNDSGMTRMTKSDPRRDHIDAAIACAMAVSRALAGDSRRSAYCDPESELFIF